MRRSARSTRPPRRRPTRVVGLLGTLSHRRPPGRGERDALLARAVRPAPQHGRLPAGVSTSRCARGVARGPGAARRRAARRLASDRLAVAEPGRRQRGRGAHVSPTASASADLRTSANGNCASCAAYMGALLRIGRADEDRNPLRARVDRRWPIYRAIEAVSERRRDAQAARARDRHGAGQGHAGLLRRDPARPAGARRAAGRHDACAPVEGPGNQLPGVNSGYATLQHSRAPLAPAATAATSGAATSAAHGAARRLPARPRARGGCRRRRRRHVGPRRSSASRGDWGRASRRRSRRPTRS